MKFLLLLCAGIFTLVAICDHFMDEFPKAYRHRRCEGRRWKRQFPAVPKEDIRRFLSHFADAFGFREEHRLKFRPDDQIGDVYNSIHRPVRWVDDMEMEGLFHGVEDRYGADLSHVDAMDMTLGELFRIAVIKEA